MTLRWFSVAMFLVLLATAAGLTRPIQVSWNFGSGPGRTSEVYVGSRTIDVRYDTTACVSRFTLEGAILEFSDVKKNGKIVPEGPPLLMLKLRKHFPGTFDRLPKVTITQQLSDATGRPTGRSEDVVFPFRKKEMATDVSDWNRGEIEATLAAPAATMGLHNPIDWSSIAVQCE